MLRLLLRGGADPLATDSPPTAPDLAGVVRGRAGPVGGFLLTCRSPLLLGAAVLHVLEQCRAGGRVLAPPQVAQLCLAAHLAGPPLAEVAEQLLAQAALQGNCFPGAGPRPLLARPHGGAARPAGQERFPAPGLAGHQCQRFAGDGASPSRVHRLAQLSSMGHVDAHDDEAGPSSSQGSQRGATQGPGGADLGSAHRHRRDLLLSLRLRRQQEAAARRDGSEDEGEGREPGLHAELDARGRWEVKLRAQLVADAAMHGAADLLAVLLR